ncbi:hypothetical protein [Herpetosiphon llansteffanensis]|uniref:hypothetical protein n=1 Tax=Herpetosiphon llansteffanensis TaxID=2094568 RepID=UPI000D7C3CB9|nr:hypothetical protein [Herpetosiphon llansteffanensis]
MTLADLTTQTVAILLPAMPVITSIGEGFANEIGKEGYHHAHALLGTIKGWFQRTPDAKAEKALNNFEDDPERYVEIFARQLERYLSEHPAVETELTETLATEKFQSIVATNTSIVEHITMKLTGAGRQEIRADSNSHISGVDMSST